MLKYEALQHAKLPGQHRAPDWAVSAALPNALLLDGCVIRLLITAPCASVQRFWTYPMKGEGEIRSACTRIPVRTEITCMLDARQ